MFLSNSFLQPTRHDLRNFILRTDIEMVAVWHDRDFAGAGAIFREIFGGVVFFGLLITADEYDVAGRYLHSQQVWDVGRADLVMLKSGNEGRDMTQIFDRITVNPRQCGGRPCVRGMRIRVVDVLELLADGMTTAEVLNEHPDLEIEDIHACLRFASQRVGNPILAA